MRTPIFTAALAVLGFALPVQAASDTDLAQIRTQLKQMQETYEQRIAALEERLLEAEKSANRDRKSVV